jgi:hypothetical protein
VLPPLAKASTNRSSGAVAQVDGDYTSELKRSVNRSGLSQVARRPSGSGQTPQRDRKSTAAQFLMQVTNMILYPI